MRLIIIFYAAFLFFFSSCDVLNSENESVNIERPIDPWARRSVLDYKPRMLTIALNSECYIAYDLEKCGLYRAWKGGVDWVGAVYTETKAMQPTVWGKDYFINNSSGDVWSIKRNGKNILPNVRFQGYRFKNKQIHLKYALITKNDTIEITERPEFIQDENGNPGLERTFWAKGLDGNTTVNLNTQPNALTLVGNKKVVFRDYFSPIAQQVRKPKPENTSNKARYWIEKSDCFTCHDWTEKTIGPSFQQVAEKYTKDDEQVSQLVSRIKEGGSGVWGTAAMNAHPNLSEADLETIVKYILSLHESDVKPEKNIQTALVKKKPTKKKEKQPKTIIAKPGFGAPLEGVHPSYDVSIIHTADTEFKVGGLAFLPDGRLAVSTWSPLGSVYILEGVETGDSSKVKVKEIASGIAEPLGLEVVNGELFVLQKHELTQLIDHDGDEIIDEYKTICAGFGVTADFHEFALGLIFKDGHFYASLSNPFRLMENEKPLPDRGKTLKIAMDGSYEWVNHGLRTPNGIGIGTDNELFVTDNQGQWLPANKLIHVREGDFHGMRWSLPDSLSDIKMVPPTIWLPQDEIANSPSEPSLLNEGPYNNQIIFGDVGHGGIKRAFVERINNSYQGVVFRFTQGMEAGINRMRRGPDGALYVGGVGMTGSWGWKGKKHGLQRVVFNDHVTFEMLSIKAKPDGFEIEFTEPLAADQGNLASDYLVNQWWYLPTKSYGGPKMDLETLVVENVKVSPSRTSVYLTIPGLKKEHVVYFRLNDEIQSNSNQKLWSGEGWYTLNNIPQ